MFRQNVDTIIKDLFKSEDIIPKKIYKHLKKSWALLFRENIFQNIDELSFANLYSKDNKSRPNVPVNIILGLEIIKELFDYRDIELLNGFHLNLEIAYALGQNELGEYSISERTLYYFRSKVLEYEKTTGINLYEKEFKKFRDDLIERFDIKTDQQRSDSFLVGSNIKKMSRVELILKTVQMILESLSDEQKQQQIENCNKYLKEEPYRMIFKKNKEEIESLLKEGAAVLSELVNISNLHEDVKNLGSRILSEQMIKNKNGELELKKSKDIKADSIQNVHDLEATYRKKGKKESRGYVENITETCNKENVFQILTDTSLDKNIVDDGTHLESRMEDLKNETKLNEMAVDGGYCRKDLIEKNKDVDFIITGIPGNNPHNDKFKTTDFIIENNSLIECPNKKQPVKQEYDDEKERISAYFDINDCNTCPDVLCCLVKCGKKTSRLIITDKKIRHDNLLLKFKNNDYLEKCKLRPAIEGTVWQFSHYIRNGKVRFRGSINIGQRMVLRAIGINFKRLNKAFLSSNYIFEIFLEKLALFFYFIKNCTFFLLKTEI
jgi:hypothetical protein